MATLTEVKIEKLHQFRAGLLAVAKADLKPKLISVYWESNRDKLRPSGMTDNVGRFIQTIADIEDIDALDGARDEIVRMLDSAIGALSAANVRPVLDELIVRVKDAKLATLLNEFNAIKNQQPNLAAIGLRTIMCLIIQERAKLSKPGEALATKQDFQLSPMLRDAIDQKIFDEGETKLIKAFQNQGLKETFDNVVHKPGSTAIITSDDLSALVENTVTKLLASIV